MKIFALAFAYLNIPGKKEFGYMEQIFYNRTAEQTLSDMDSCRRGLSNEEAAERLQKYGQNALAEENKKSVVQVFF